SSPAIPPAPRPAARTLLCKISRLNDISPWGILPGVAREELHYGLDRAICPIRLYARPMCDRPELLQSARTLGRDPHGSRRNAGAPHDALRPGRSFRVVRVPQ